jgi:hypothetical protein
VSTIYSLNLELEGVDNGNDLSVLSGLSSDSGIFVVLKVPQRD